MAWAPGVLYNDRDADGDPLTAVLEMPPINGQFVLYPNGAFLYIPRAGFFGRDSFTYRAFDGTDYSEATLVNIVVVRR